MHMYEYVNFIAQLHDIALWDLIDCAIFFARNAEATLVS